MSKRNRELLEGLVAEVQKVAANVRYVRDLLEGPAPEPVPEPEPAPEPEPVPEPEPEPADLTVDLGPSVQWSGHSVQRYPWFPGARGAVLTYTLTDLPPYREPIILHVMHGDTLRQLAGRLQITKSRNLAYRASWNDSTRFMEKPKQHGRIPSFEPLQVTHELRFFPDSVESKCTVAGLDGNNTSFVHVSNVPSAPPRELVVDLGREVPGEYAGGVYHDVQLEWV